VNIAGLNLSRKGPNGRLYDFQPVFARPSLACDSASGDFVLEQTRDLESSDFKVRTVIRLGSHGVFKGEMA